MKTGNSIILIASFLLLTASSLKGQDTLMYGRNIPKIEKTYDVYLGFSLQGSSRHELAETARRYVEVGLSKTQIISTRPYLPDVVTIYIAEEIPVNNTDRIYGTKAGGWIRVWVFSMGLAAVYYTDFDRGNLKIRPELGLGLQRFRLGVGYNIPTIGNDEFTAMSDFNMQAFFNYSIPFVRKGAKI